MVELTAAEIRVLVEARDLVEAKSKQPHPGIPIEDYNRLERTYRALLDLLKHSVVGGG